MASGKSHRPEIPSNAKAKIVSGKKWPPWFRTGRSPNPKKPSWIFSLKVNTIDEAVAIAKDCPGLSYGIQVEVRQVAGECPLIEQVREGREEAPTRTR